MNAIYEGWLHRKLQAQPYEPMRERVVSRQWQRITGGRILFGGVTLRIALSTAFAFEDKCEWPEDHELFSYSVLDGILDALLIDLEAAPGRARFTLEAIEWRQETSIARAYRKAAREAVSEAFGLDEKERMGNGHAV